MTRDVNDVMHRKNAEDFGIFVSSWELDSEREGSTFEFGLAACDRGQMKKSS